jgi:nucleotide-binding universal stress UspA family protein
MSLKDLLVVVDESSSAEARVDLAVNLASAFDARLVGLHVTPDVAATTPVYARLPFEIRQLLTDRQRETADHARAIFTRRAGHDAEWREARGSASDVAALHGRYCDLVVAGQVSPDAEGNADALVFPDRIALAVGRPVLVVPYIGTFTSIGARVLVAWNATREATRAVADAMPFLQKAAAVTVIAVNPRSGPAGHGDIPGADIALHLARHGVKARAESIAADDIAIADILLSRASDIGADLLVMGCYGHSRIRELVIGGVTRQILQEMTLPVLMSH